MPIFHTGGDVNARLVNATHGNYELEKILGRLRFVARSCKDIQQNYGVREGKSLCSDHLYRLLFQFPLNLSTQDFEFSAPPSDI